MRSLTKLALVALALAVFAVDASAGPLQRLRARRSGGCSGGSCASAGCTPSYAPPAGYAGFSGATYGAVGCPGGRCPVR